MPEQKPDEQPRWKVEIQTENGTYEKYDPKKHDIKPRTA